ncbi:pantoate--beta-alanine ligase [Aquihabitans sp. G128]|uniref:pantoate--beta-alanine ligase n=1 Tax=Aquihabitans sp. G128 TaxID=2849779 RepID=UPI001C2343A2|nr:pantoate--beta-alanine ligase [Aquihabitans sp. G128]QXC59269.1 pantoate--beta-alanine ligase [Aquihabitans sp. G128]
MPEVHETIAGFRAALELAREDERGIGFVPTMGYLHEGHASLMRQASAENETAVASIFVNPLQFAANEDLGAYPRDLERDLALADECGVAHVFTPSVAEMYPVPVLTTVSVGGVTERFEGASRPEHFAGVATVVAKLFSIAGPCRAYFGDKDFQQLAVVRRMVADLSMPVDVVGCPIVREPDGLAMSSRNVYLTPAQRAAAPALHRGLQAAAAAAADGERNVDRVRAALADAVAAEPEATLDYAELVDALTLEPATVVGGTEQRLLVAARFGTTRLLDNLAVDLP